MTNFEKHGQTIKDVGYSFSLVKGAVRPCEYTDCPDCEFLDCAKERIKWLFEECEKEVE